MATSDDAVDLSAAAAMSLPPHFPLRSLPPEIQFNVFRQLIGNPTGETALNAAARKRARTGMLLLDKIAYQTFAPDFFKQATVDFHNPVHFLNLIVRKSSRVCVDNLRAISWTHGHCSERNFVNIPDDIEAWVNIILNMIPQLSELEHVDILFPEKNERRINRYNFVTAAHALDAEGWWKFTEGKYHGFLNQLESKLSSSLTGIHTSHNVEVQYLRKGPFLSERRAEEWLIWSADDQMPADAMYVSVGPATVTISKV